MSADQSSWPPGTIVTWHQSCVFAGLNAAQTEVQIATGINRWTEVCGIVFQRVQDVSQARLAVSSVPIDQAFGILGETELPRPDEPNAQLSMHLDNAENWRALLLPEVVWHEAGHAIGLQHAPMGSNNIMAPVYNPATAQFGPWDTQEAQSRYGPPVPVPTPVPVPEIPVDPSAVPFATHFPILIAGKVYQITFTGMFAVGR